MTASPGNDRPFEGHGGGGEHRTTGQRARCFGCGEWCYPDDPCGQVRCCAAVKDVRDTSAVGGADAVTTFADLLAGVDDDTVISRLVDLYHDDMNRLNETVDDYQQALARLRSLTPRPSRCRLELRHIIENDSSGFVMVNGIDEGDMTFAVEDAPKAEWLGMTVDADTARHWPVADIAAHVLWTAVDPPHSFRFERKDLLWE